MIRERYQWKARMRFRISDYRKISNTIRTLVQYAPQTFTGEPWENVSLAVQYAPVLATRRRRRRCCMPSATSTKGVSCSVARADKVTLIGSNCPASRVGRCVDCEGGRTAQIFSDCVITKYLSRATARRPCGSQTIAAVVSLHSCYCLASSTHSSPAELPWTSRNTDRPPTVTSPVAHDRRPRPSSCRTASI